jgi:hypothetical protein
MQLPKIFVLESYKYDKYTQMLDQVKSQFKDIAKLLMKI